MRQKRVFWVLAALLLALTSAAGVAAQADNADEEITEYTVREGNTLDQIAAFFDVALDCLAADNDLLGAEELTVGRVLVISSACPPYDGETAAATAPDAGQGGAATAQTQPQVQPPISESGAGTTYVVQRGDRLSRLATRFGVTVRCLVLANGIFNPNLIFIGQTLLIPPDCSLYDQGGGDAPGPGPVQPGPSGTVYLLQTQQGIRRYVLQPDSSYIVRAGDILDFIGLAFGLQTQCLAASNQLPDPARIRPGQRLFINFACPPWDGPPGPGRRLGISAVG
jgi:LysM repeat protein